MKKTVALLLSTVLLFGAQACAGTEDALDDAQQRASEAVEEAQDVDWAAYPEDLQDKVRDYIAEADCEGLNEELDKLDEGEDTELTAFLKEQIEALDCA